MEVLINVYTALGAQTASLGFSFPPILISVFPFLGFFCSHQVAQSSWLHSSSLLEAPAGKSYVLSQQSQQRSPCDTMTLNGSCTYP